MSVVLLVVLCIIISAPGRILSNSWLSISQPFLVKMRIRLVKLRRKLCAVLLSLWRHLTCFRYFSLFFNIKYELWWEELDKLWLLGTWWIRAGLQLKNVYGAVVSFIVRDLRIAFFRFFPFCFLVFSCLVFWEILYLLFRIKEMWLHMSWLVLGLRNWLRWAV